MFDVDVLILFFCKGRYGVFGLMINDEIKGIYFYWNKLLIGFFFYGEIGNLSVEEIEFYNEICVVVVLKE